MSMNGPGLDAVAERPLLTGDAAALSPPALMPPRSRALTPDGFFHLTMLGFALLSVVSSVIGLRLTQTIVPLGQILALLPLLTALLAGAGFYRWRREPKAFNLVMMTTWAYVFGYLHIVPMFIAARRQTPFEDTLLARVDAALGMEVPDVLRVMEAYPTVGQFLNVCYGTLLFLITVAIMAPPLCNRLRAAKEFAIGGVLAALIALPLFALFQARGPWVIYGYPSSAAQDEFMRMFAAIRSEEWYTLDLFYRHGLITFPSFHALLAVLAAAALWPIPYLRWPAALLATLIVVSTVTTGWHYVIDVIAGLAVAALVRVLAMGYSRLEARLTRAPGLAGGVKGGGITAFCIKSR